MTLLGEVEQGGGMPVTRESVVGLALGGLAY